MLSYGQIKTFREVDCERKNYFDIAITTEK